MYIIQNAFKNLLRNRGRNIMVGLIIFAIIATTVVALSINNTSDTVIASYKDRFASEVTISPNMEKLMEEARANATTGENGRQMIRMARPELSTELQLKFATSQYLKETIVTGSISANSDSVTAIDQDATDTSGEQTDSDRTGGGMMMRFGGNFRLYGDYYQDFNDGNRELQSDGVSKMPGDGECIVSQELADANNIKVGDTLDFTAEMRASYDTEDPQYSELESGDTVTINGVNYTVSDGFLAGQAAREVTYSLKVSGIYLDLTDEYANADMPQMAAMNRRNEVIATLSTLLDKRLSDESGVAVNSTYYLKNPETLPDFEAEVRAMGLPDNYDVSTDASGYDRVVKPVEGLKKISVAFIVIVIALGAVILLLLTSIAIRERKYEIGVLRAMGMKKSRVALGLWTELLAITCACLIIGLGVGAAAAQPVTDALIKSQVAAEEESTQTTDGQGDFRFGGGRMMGRGGPMGMIINGGGQNTEPLSSMKINIGFETIFEIIGIALLLATLAGLLSISKITKYEPIKILMERN